MSQKLRYASGSDHKDRQSPLATDAKVTIMDARLKSQPRLL